LLVNFGNLQARMRLSNEHREPSNFHKIFVRSEDTNDHLLRIIKQQVSQNMIQRFPHELRFLYKQNSASSLLA
jgi:hypothetical protein